ncbi:MAG: HEAT repeat domain-containing protein [Acidobacteriota bacterium]|jgi:hypothetical protein
MTRAPIEPDEVKEFLRDGSEEAGELLLLWEALDRLPEPKPTDAARRRFYGFLERQAHLREDRRERRWRRLAAVAAGCALLAGIPLALRLLAPGGAERAGPEDDRAAAIPGGVGDELASRLGATAWLGPGGDDEVAPRLLDSLLHDPDVNVRLGAVGALADRALRPDVRRGIGEALEREQAPLVQYALVELIVRRQIRDSVPALRRRLHRGEMEPLVEHAAREGLASLERG